MSKRLLCFLVDDEDTDMPVIAQINAAYSRSDEVVVEREDLARVLKCSMRAPYVDAVLALLEGRP